MKIRMHRGSLADAMATAEDIAPDMPAVRTYLAAHGIEGGTVSVEPYGIDQRIGWDTHIVKVDGYPMAWTDGPLHDYAEPASSTRGEIRPVSNVKRG